ncbi:hypothetical protein GQ600_6416 [Phytophthora cactorum]|nr:hypothetical protein GQ600_6416 [Phytophthora cactorum]
MVDPRLTRLIPAFTVGRVNKLDEVLSTVGAAVIGSDCHVLESLLHRRVLYDEPGPETKIFTSYDALREFQLDYTMLIVPKRVCSLLFSASSLAQSEHQKSAPPSTHVAYNCTSTSSIWNLQQDPNVLKLENFETLSGEITAVATIGSWTVTRYCARQSWSATHSSGCVC